MFERTLEGPKTLLAVGVLAFGASAAIIFEVPFAGLLSLALIGFAVGMPLTMAIRDQTDGAVTLAALTVASAFALSAMAVQILNWVGVTSGPMLILLTASYSIALGLAVHGTRSSRPRDGQVRAVGHFSPLKQGAGSLTGNVLGLASVVAAIAAGRAIDYRDIDGWGLISGLGLIYVGAVGLAALATWLLLRAAIDGDARHAIAIPFLWLGVGHVVGAAAHAHARFPISWIHLGFVRLISEELAGDVLIDARFAWPGFFGLFVAPAASLSDQGIDLLMRAWPIAILAIAALFVSKLASRAHPDVELIGPIAGTVFVLFSWSGQDYFSPQSMGFIWYLAMITVIESGTPGASAGVARRLPGLRQACAFIGNRSSNTSTLLLTSVLGIATVVSHPLAPFFVILALIVLAAYGRTQAAWIAVGMGIIYAAWFVIAAEPWWSTRIEELTSQIGGFLENFRSGTSDRVATSSLVHTRVTQLRTVFALMTFGLTGAVGIALLFPRWKHLRPNVPLLPLAIAPALAAALQSYGGEITIRVLLFSLPWCSITIARLILQIPTRRLPPVVALGAVAVLPLLIVTRFGNESFEMSTAPDRHAVELAYSLAGDNSALVADNGFMPWGDRFIGEVPHITETLTDYGTWLETVSAAAADSDRNELIVVLTNTEDAYGQHIDGKPENWTGELADWLLKQPRSQSELAENGTWVIVMQLGEVSQ